MGFVAAIYAVAAVIGASAAYSNGQDQKKLAEANADIARANGQTALNSSQADAARQSDRNRQLVAQQEAQGAATGVLTTEGSPLALMSQTASHAEQDKLTTLYKGQLAYIKGQNQANMFEAQGDMAAKAGTMGAYASLIGGGAKVASMNSSWFEDSTPAKAPKGSGGGGSSVQGNFDFSNDTSNYG